MFDFGTPFKRKNTDMFWSSLFILLYSDCRQKGINNRQNREVILWLLLNRPRIPKAGKVVNSS